jgi:hypothetical protein
MGVRSVRRPFHLVIRDNFLRASLPNKLKFIVQFAAFALVLVPVKIFRALTGSTTHNGRLRRITTSVFTLPYAFMLENQSIIIRGKDGTAALLTPPNATPETLREIEANVGPVAAILMQGLAHEENVGDWKALVPSLKVYCAKAVEEGVKEIPGVTVDGTYEDSAGRAALANFGAEPIYTSEW